VRAQLLLGGVGFAVLDAMCVIDHSDSDVAFWCRRYPVVVAAFNGTWWDAAQIYRTWVLKEAGWTKKGSLSTRTDVPEWVIRAPLWIREVLYSTALQLWSVCARCRSHHSTSVLTLVCVLVAEQSEQLHSTDGECAAKFSQRRARYY
jgi:hypothetical protein